MISLAQCRRRFRCRQLSSYAFLSGAGISVSAGLPTAWAFNREIGYFLANGVPAEAARLTGLLTTGYAAKGPARVRFEQIIQILRQFDPDLEMLRTFDETGVPGYLHRFLAWAITRQAAVFTTNFDSLIERAYLQARGPLARLHQAIYDERDHPAAERGDSFEAYARARKPQAAVLKLHGSLRVLRLAQTSSLPAWALDGIPSIGATLDKLGRATSDLRLERFKEDVLNHCTRARIVCVLGYSGGDDFDVSPSLCAAAGLSRGLIWIRHGGSRIRIVDGMSRATTNLLPPGLRDLYRKPNTVIICGNTDEIVCSLFGFARTPAEPPSRNVNPIKAVLVGYQPYVNMNRPTRQIISAEISEGAGDWSHARKLYEAALRLARTPEDELLRQKALSRLGSLERSRGRLPEAMANLRKAARLARDDSRQLGPVLNTIGIVHMDRGELVAARAQFAKALRASKAAGNDKLQAAVLTNLGLVERKGGRNRAALRFHKRALDLSARSRSREDMARDYGNLGTVYLRMKEYSEAIEAYDQAIRLARLTGARNTLATTLMNRAIVLKHLGRLADAQKAADAAFDIEKALGRKEGIARYWSMVANILILRKRPEDGVRMLEKAISIQRGLKRREGLADDLESLADLLRDLKRISRSRKAYKESYRYFGLLGNRGRQQRILRKLSRMSLAA